MATFGRVLLWMVVLIAPGGFLLVPVLAAASLHSRGEPEATFSERWRALISDARGSFSKLQRYWTKS